MKLVNRLYFLLVSGLLLVISLPIMAQEKIEVVLLIDISGSMKKNDPKNLRIPASNLFINLLKNRAKLSIFTFSTTTKLLQPENEVTDDYEKRFHEKQNQITSSGQHTNILSALETANKSLSDNKLRIIVLLTDGKIDRGSLLQGNADKKIINEQLIPELKKNNIKVYPIGLGTDVDADLLDLLATQTNGVYQFINSMSDAEKSLYNIFTSAVPAQGIPLDKDSSGIRQIRVDSSVSQLSVILEKKNEHSKIVILKPDGTSYKLNNLNYNKFIFIDIKKPAPGIWKLKGDEQTIERAIILANLELVSTKLSGEYFNRELITVSTTLKLEKKEMALPKLLENTEIKLDLKNEHGDFSTLIPFTKDALFKKEFILDLQPGLTKETLTARNNSFLREMQSLFKVQPLPFKQSIEKDALKIELINSGLKRDSVQINLIDKDHNLSLPLFQGDGNWQTSIEDLCKLQKLSTFIIHAEIQAQSKNGRAFTLIMPDEKITCVTAPEKLISSITPINLNKSGEHLPLAPKTPQQLKTSKHNQLINLFYILSSVFFIALIGAFWFFYQKTQNAYKEKIDQLGNNDDR